MSLLRAGVPVALLRVRGASGQSLRLVCALEDPQGSRLHPLHDCPVLSSALSIQHLAFGQPRLGKQNAKSHGSGRETPWRVPAHPWNG